MPDYRFDGNNWVDSSTPDDPIFGAAGSCVYVSQNLYTSANLYSNLNWFSYGRLDTPNPYAPCEGCNECWDVHPFSLNRTGGGTGQNKSLSGAVFEWHPVTGADYYIVQWCKSDNFQGPTLRAAKVSTTYYELKLYSDIRRGDKVFWRVMAYDTSGKVSAKSTPRDFTYCKDNKRPKPKKDKGGNDTGSGAAGSHPDIANCEKANFCGKITGPDNLMCCHGKQMYHLQFAWSCKDEDGANVYEFVSVQWAVTGNPNDGGAVDGGIEIVAQNNQTVTIHVKGKQSQKATIAAQITLKDTSTNTAFSCTLKKSINVDCATGFPSYKPWLRTYMPITHVTHRDYVGSAICSESLTKTYANAVVPNSLTDDSGLTDLTKLCSGTYVATGSVVQVQKIMTPVDEFDPERPEPDECNGQDPGGGEDGETGEVAEIIHEARVALPMPWDCRHIDVYAVEECIAKCYSHPRSGHFSINDISNLQLYAVPEVVADPHATPPVAGSTRKHCLKWRESTFYFCRTKYNLVKYQTKYGPNWKYSCVVDQDTDTNTNCCPTTTTTTTTLPPGYTTTTTTTTLAPTTTTTTVYPTTTTSTTTTTCTVNGGVVDMSLLGSAAINEGECRLIELKRSGGSYGECCVELSVTSVAAGITYTLHPTTHCFPDYFEGTLHSELCITHDSDCIPEIGTGGQLVIEMTANLEGQCCNMGDKSLTVTVYDDDVCPTTTTTTTTAAPTTTTTTTTAAPTTTTTTTTTAAPTTTTTTTTTAAPTTTTTTTAAPTTTTTTETPGGGVTTTTTTTTTAAPGGTTTTSAPCACTGLSCGDCGCFEWIWSCDPADCINTGSWAPGDDCCGEVGGFTCGSPGQPATTPATNDTRVWVCCDEP